MLDYRDHKDRSQGKAGQLYLWSTFHAQSSSQPQTEEIIENYKNAEVVKETYSDYCDALFQRLI